MNVRLKYVFFVDRDLGNSFCRKLNENGIEAKKHSDFFRDDTADKVWLREVGKKGWFVLTRDKKIRSRQDERAAVEKNNVGLFAIVGKSTFDELAENFIATIQKVKKFIDKNPRPFIAKVYRPQSPKSKKIGEVKMWVDL